MLCLLVAGDTLVTTRENMQDLLNNMWGNPPLFVGWSDKESLPCLVDLTKDEKEETFKVLQEILCSTDKVIEVNTYRLNLPCLVGVLLGFPLVYNFSEQVLNPLDNLDLVVMRMEVTAPGFEKTPATPVSFSVPLKLKTEEKVVNRLNLWWGNLSGGLSFGVPFSEGGLTLTLYQQIQNLPTVML